MFFQPSQGLVRLICSTLIVSLLSQIVVPGVALALTSGPTQPEFTSFEPVNASNMVNEFTGDFMYNIPLIEVPGPHGSSYPLTLSYHSNVTPEQESSWVGLGWTLNVGAITRNKSGFADDWKDAAMTYYNERPASWTATAGGSIGSSEVFGKDLGKVLGASISSSIRYNNYTGFGLNAGIGVHLNNGLLSLGANHSSNGTHSFSLNVNPASYLKKKIDFNKLESSLKESANRDNKVAQAYIKGLQNANTSFQGSSYNIFQPVQASSPTYTTRYTGHSYNFSVGLEGDPAPVPVGATGNVFGSFSIQKNVPITDFKAYGYLYTGNGEVKEEGNVAYDYGIDKDNPYDRQDNFLGVPLNHADVFVATGEGIAGGFRLYHQKNGHFYPDEQESQTTIGNVGGEFTFGGTIGPGADVGAGSHLLKEGGWSDASLAKFEEISAEEDINEKVFFRFNNDPGGNWLHPSGDAPLATKIVNSKPAVAHELAMNRGKRSGRSSFIDFRTNEQINHALEPDANGNSASYEVYTLDHHTNTLAQRKEGGLADEFKSLIGELAVVNEAGYQYVYGLPVYSRNESNLSYDVSGAPEQDVVNNQLVRVRVKQGEDPAKVGEEISAPYASQYLLSQITTPEYVDRQADGPTPDDLGGYTRFFYEKAYGLGKSEGFYKWRIPYNATVYNRNSLSSSLDDIGTVSSGEKEVYYLKAVATKTHVAVFETSEHREDGYDANKEERNALYDLDAVRKGKNGLKKLNKISLYSLQDEGVNYDPESDEFVILPEAKPIKAVNFSYSQELSPGLPNAANNSGKLTLKKVWFDYYGIERSTISPYIFEYQYPADQYPVEYAAIKEDVSKFSASGQNPVYSPFAIDGWGFYQEASGGESRFQKLQSWVDQNTEPSFDPAAWHLKVIKLPTGGEIHVQYEQDDYAYVQDQPAHVMVPLQELNMLSEDKKQRKFYLNTDSVGLTESLPLLEKMIRDRYITGTTGKKKLYFKFLYKLMGVAEPDISHCNADYISGYADVKNVGIDTDPAGKPWLYVELGAGSGDDEYELPKQVCEDFVITQRAGMLSPSGNCDPATAGIQSKGKTAKELMYQLLALSKTLSRPASLCQQMNESLSYLRLPVPTQKKGGGIRVKRLLTYDGGYGTPRQQPVLYGHEYTYKKYDDYLGTWRSSGVATNEPATFREENILVDYIPRKEQKWHQKIIAGRDKEQAEGPLGEAIYPGPSVGYSQVIVQNIHTGRANEGFSVKEFYTAKEFPVVTLKTDLESKGNVHLPFPLGLVNYYVNKTRASQGFSFILNNMHGQSKRTASYEGVFTSGELPDDASLVTEQVLHYFDVGRGKFEENSTTGQVEFNYYPGEEIPVTNEFGTVEMEKPGKEMDITFAHRAVKDQLNDANFELDFSASYLPLPFPFPTIMPSITRSESESYTYASSKVVRYPAVVKKVVSYQDGIYHTQENIAFDRYSGRAVATRSYDEFEGAYISYAHPASWEYPGLQQKALFQNKQISAAGLVYNQTEGAIAFDASLACDDLLNFSSGDLIKVSSGENLSYFHVDSIDYSYNRLFVLPSRLNTYIPADGGSIDKITILQTGRTNQLSMQVANTTFHSEDEGYQLPELDKEMKWDFGDEFATALNTRLADIKNSQKNKDLFDLPGPFYHMNVSGFATEELRECGLDPTDVTVQNLYFEYEKEEERVHLRILSIEISCPETGELIRIK